jgi:hypothetical protein
MTTDVTPTASVPDLTDLTLDSAQGQYEDFDLSIDDRQTSDEPTDSIISQFPDPGEEAEEGSTISVVVSTGPEETTQEPTVTDTPCPEDNFVYTSSGALSMCVSSSWGELDESPWTTEGQDGGYTLSASPDLENFVNTFEVPGVVLSATDNQQILSDTTYNEILKFTSVDYSNNCTDGGSATEYTTQDEVYTGVYKEWLDCDNTNTDVRVFALTPKEARDVLVLLEIQLVTRDDFITEELILYTFEVDPSGL